MSNPYIRNLRKNNNEGSENIFSNFNLDGLQKGFQDLTSNVQKSTGFTKERVQKVSELSEVNMELTEDVLQKLDKVLNVYNVTGILLGTASTLVIINELKKLIFRKQI